MSADLDKSTRPNKWIKRGVQPEVAPKPPSPMQAIRSLMEQIRLEQDPAAKAVLERQFESQCKAHDMVDPNALPVDIHALYASIRGTLSHGAIIIPESAIPDNIGKGEWQAMHKAIMGCRNSAAQWLAKSRKFAADKWGVEYLMESESQLELALGIEHKQRPTRIEDAGAGLRKIEGMVRAFGTIAVDALSDEQVARVIELLEPVATQLEVLRGRLGGLPTTVQ
jgi:hypothetical protein